MKSNTLGVDLSIIGPEGMSRSMKLLQGNVRVNEIFARPVKTANLNATDAVNGSAVSEIQSAKLGRNFGSQLLDLLQIKINDFLL